MPSFQVNAKWASMSEVVPNLYICGVSALKPQTLIDLEIGLVVNCTREVPNLNVRQCQRVKLWLDDTDDQDLLAHLDPVCDRIHEAVTGGTKALVHCVAGVSRSAAFVLAYLIRYESMSLRQAYRFLADRRAMVRPNLGFWRQLIAYERRLRPDRPVSVRIVDVSGPDDSDRSIDGDDDSSADDDNDDDRCRRVKGHYLPDVYLGDETASEEDENDKENCRGGSPTKADQLRRSEKKRRHSSGSGRVRFVPKLESVPEHGQEPSEHLLQT